MQGPANVYKNSGSCIGKSNYRPISVVIHIAKLIERTVLYTFWEYLLKRYFITPDQSAAYLKDHSTQTCLHKVVDDWYENINDGLMTGVCFLDIKKCFDTIDQGILLKKLCNYGVNGTALDWFKPYLSNRKHLVCINGNSSRVKDVIIGVP